MQDTAIRRQEMLRFLSDRRRVTLAILMNEFNISRSTAKRDLQILACSAPVFTNRGKGGGVYVSEKWYINCIYLTKSQEALLLKLLNGLNTEEQKILQSILNTFAQPKR